MENKSVTLICNARLPSEKAHPWQVLQMWQAFALCAPAAKLLYPFRFQKEEALRQVGRDFCKYYDMQEPGPSWRLPNLDLMPIYDFLPSLVSFCSRIQQSSFSVAAALWFCEPSHRDTMIWSREILALPLLARVAAKTPVFYEMHRFPGSNVKRQLSWLHRVNGVICLTEGMRDKLIEVKYPAEKICVEPDAYNEKLFSKLPRRHEALAALSLDSRKKKVLYTGHFYKWKGVDALVEAMRSLPDVEAHLVGGMPQDQEALKHRHSDWPSNVICHSHVPPQEIPQWLAVADVAVVPNSAESVLSRLYTSPLKLFEILAAGVPLVLSDLPSLREVVSEDMAHFAKPDDAASLASALRTSLNEGPEAKQQKIDKGQQKVSEHSWQKRAQRLYDFMSQR